MRDAKVIDPDDIKAMLAEKFGVPAKNIIKTQYSYTVALDGQDEPRDGE